jgi:hypothetical protein
VPVEPSPRPVEQLERPVVREEAAAAREEAVRTPPPPPPAPKKAEEPRIDPKELLESAGLVMIETDRAKVHVQPAIAEDVQPVGRPRRERPKPPPQDDSLVQIETKR